MVTYEEFKAMLQEKIAEMTDPDAAFLVSRLITYTDDVMFNREPPIPPPTLPDLTPNPKDGNGEETVSTNGTQTSASGGNTIPSPTMPSTEPNSKGM